MGRDGSPDDLFEDYVARWLESNGVELIIRADLVVPAFDPFQAALWLPAVPRFRHLTAPILDALVWARTRATGGMVYFTEPADRRTSRLIHSLHALVPPSSWRC